METNLTTSTLEAYQAKTNIPSNSLVVISKQTETTHRRVKLVTEAQLQLTGFAIAQFMEGVELVVAEATIKTMEVSTVKLILKLSKATTLLQSGPVTGITVDYKELTLLREWLELRMIHCEKEREERTTITYVKDGPSFPKFNPDTYIGQKLLLLDLRELMLGEIESKY